MCGRFAASASTDDYVEIFGVQEVVDSPQPSFNLAPTDPIPAIVERVRRETGDSVRKLVTPRWGLVPSWSKDASGAARLINARVETVATKPAFRKAFAERRCLIPSDGFYEWRPVDAAGAAPGGRRGPRKQPYFIHPAAGGLFVMAGLYEFWRRPDGEWLTTATILTTTSTDAVGRLHDRMPLSVRPADWAAWLDPARRDAAEAVALLWADDALATYPVSTAVNSVAHDSPELIVPIPEADALA